MYQDKDFKYHSNEDKPTSVLLVITCILSVLIVTGCLMMTTTGCQYIPEMTKAVEEIATDDAITIAIDKDAFQKETDVSVNIEIKNKEQLQQLLIQPQGL